MTAVPNCRHIRRRPAASFCARPLTTTLAALAALALLPAIASAQHRVEGRTIDPQGRAVPRAQVMATTPAAVVTTTADDSGRFVFADLGAAIVDLSATAPGLGGEARAVAASSSAPVEIVLRIAAVAESLVVTASQIDQPLSRTADSVTVITARDLEARQVTSVGEALATVPGFTVARSGGPGTLTSLFPRGGESDYTLVLVDGVRANSFGGGIDLSQVPIADVDRIEVVRGPQSAIYGADAIGGVVQIITRQGGAPSAAGQVETGSRGTRRLIGSTTGSLGGWRWQSGGDYFEDEGFTGIAPASGERVSNDDARERQGWLGAGWRAARGTDVQASFRYVDTERGAPGPYGSDPANRFGGVDVVSRGWTERMAVAARVVHPWSGPSSRIRQRIDLDVADFDLRFQSGFGTSESDTRRVHGRVQTDAALASTFGFSGGVEWLTERARSTFITAGGQPIPVERRSVGTFAEARWNGHERVSVQAGVRAEHITRHALAANPAGFSPRPAFDDDAVLSVNPKVSASWTIGPSLPASGARSWTRLQIAAGTGIRPPDAFEISSTDNPDLRPERSRSVEVGMTQALAGGAVQLQATTFFNRYDDLIVSVGSLRDVSRYRTDNVSNARARGLETTAAMRLAGGAALRAAYTYLDTEIRAIDGTAQAPSPYRVGDRLLRRPAHQGSVAADWTRNRVTMFLALKARGATLDAEPAFGPGGGLFENTGHAVVDLGGSYRLRTGIEVFARALNLFDRRYEEVLGYPSPGRTGYVGIRVAAGR